MERHIKIVHEGIKQQCDLCDKSYNTKARLRQHKAVIHDGKIPDIKCPLCDKLFQEASHLRRHTNDVHEKVKKYACDLCEWRFAQSGQLKTHKKGKHKIDC